MGYLQEDVPLETWLEGIEGTVARVLKDYRRANNVSKKTRLAPAAVGAWLKDTMEPLLDCPLDMHTAGYLVPASAFAKSARQTATYMDVEVIDRLPRITPLVLNPQTVPDGARLSLARVGITPKLNNKTLLAELQVPSKAPKAKKEEKKEKQEVKREPDDELDGDSDFEVCVEPDASILPDVAQPETREEEEEAPVAGVSVAMDKLEIESSADLTKFLHATGGTSLLVDRDEAGDQSTAATKTYYSYKDITAKRDTGLLGKRESAKVREVIEQDPRERHTLDDIGARRKAERKRRDQELDKFFGMKRQTITPELRQELQTLSLRGYIDPHKHYRGAKRQLDLAEQESGFFEIGTVVAGGVHDRRIHADGSTMVTVTNRKKKAKSLVKTMLLE